MNPILYLYYVIFSLFLGFSFILSIQGTSNTIYILYLYIYSFGVKDGIVPNISSLPLYDVFVWLFILTING